MAGLNKMSPHLDWFSAVSYHAMGVLTDMSSARLVIACFPAWAACVMKVWRDTARSSAPAPTVWVPIT